MRTIWVKAVVDMKYKGLRNTVFLHLWWEGSAMLALILQGEIPQVQLSVAVISV